MIAFWVLYRHVIIDMNVLPWLCQELSKDNSNSWSYLLGVGAIYERKDKEGKRYELGVYQNIPAEILIRLRGLPPVAHNP